eukprot:GHRR01003357.1.p1 GENE.GHRR01003357.1~~GHRR01003357.1.p1  ORF type:complete len:325 (+),score=48.97 GHRR01003357.1:589-1563(+)
MISATNRPSCVRASSRLRSGSIPVCLPAYRWHHRQQHHSAMQLVCAASGTSGSSDQEGDSIDFPEPCMPAFVTMDQNNPHYSEFTIDVTDYPGLLRVITWVMNGLGCRVHNAVLKTTDDGAAHDVFWVTDLRGRKLSDAVADEVAERLEEYVSYCAPPKLEGDFKEFHCGDISISNLLHPQWTQVSITADLFSPGLLLELSSLIHGQGLHICEAVVRSGSENPIPCSLVSNPDAIPEPLPGKRVMRFWLKEGRSGNKLDYADVNSLVYTLRLCLGGTSLPQKPPNSDLNSLACDSPNSSITKGSSGANGAGLVMGQATGPATVF